MRKLLVLAGLFSIALLLVLTGQSISQAQQDATATPTQSMPGMGMDDMATEYSSDDLVPLVRGIFDGEDVFFIHTETSDADISELLTDMMGPEVITVSSLAEISEELLDDVYVFTNGVSGGGPLGFQPDVFASVPGDEDYTPLRRLNLITWQEDTSPRQLNSVPEIEAALEDEEIAIEQLGVVINMPILVWKDEHR
ncbi:MAG: hypothetical protein L0154_19410 [Chloroflexi bacterium]|nr:hypothetical protein [Chloroflexota bacterium]